MLFLGAKEHIAISVGLFQMCPKCNKCSHGDCINAVSVATKQISRSCIVDSLITSSQQSTSMTMSESPAPTFVYSRRGKRGCYDATSSATEVPNNAKRSCFLSFVSSDVLSVEAKENNEVSGVERETEAVGVNPMPIAGSQQSLTLNRTLNNGCLLLEDRESDNAHKVLQRAIDVDSVNDSCSSSKSNIELALDTLKGEMEDNCDNGDCSSSSIIATEVTRDTPSEKDACISILKNAALLSSTSTPFVEGGDTSSKRNFSRSCKICDNMESITNMLICDSCEDAFHLSCCNPQMKEIPKDEWFCGLCLRKRQNHLRKLVSGLSLVEMENGKEEEINPIYLMLRETEPYRTSVVVGKGFQAEVPEWSGPINSDEDEVGEPLEIDPSDNNYFHRLNQSSLSVSSDIGNWLQCRAVIEGTGEDNDGAICGKWRRAPLFEEQTDNWECFCAVSWDPYHADCAVPQELEPDQVLKQLKYVETLKSRTSAKRQKQGRKRNRV